MGEGGGGGKGRGEEVEEKAPEGKEKDEGLFLQPLGSKRMLSKRKRPYDASELPPASRLRENIRDIFASNTLPAARVQSLLNDASDAGVDDCRAFRGIPHNAARNLRRSFLKRCLWPDLYHATVRVLDRTTGGEKESSVAFLLPHEIAHKLHKHGHTDVLTYTGGLDPVAGKHFRSCKLAAGDVPLVPIGLWGDESHATGIAPRVLKWCR